MAEPLLSNPDPDAPSLVGGEYGAPAFQTIEQPSGERTVENVPRATMVQPAPLPSDFGVFHDLVPQERPQVGGVDFGVFSDLIPGPPPSITPASDAVVSASKDIIGGPQVFSPEEEKAAVMNAPDWAQALARPAVSAGKLLAGQIPTSTEQLTSMVPMLTGTGTRGLGGFVGEAAKAGVSLAANMKATTTTEPFTQEWWDNVMPVAMAGLQAAGIGLHELPGRGMAKPPVQVERPPVQVEAPPVQTRAVEPAEAMRPPPTAEPVTGAPEPVPAAEATVPVMITKRMEADLRGMGYEQAAIDKMTPQQANDILRSTTPETPAAAEQPPTVAEPAPGTAPPDFITSDHPLAANLKPIGGTEPAFARKTAQDLFDQGKPVYSVLPDGEEAVRIKSAADIGKYDPSELHVLEPAAPAGEAKAAPDAARQIKRTGIIDLPNGDTIRVLESDAQSGKFDVVAIRGGKRSVISDPANPTDLRTAQDAAVAAASGKVEEAAPTVAVPAPVKAAVETPIAKPSLGTPHELVTKRGGEYTEMADRASRVSVLLRLNDQLPVPAYDAEALGRVANGQIDAVQDYLVRKYNETKAPPRVAEPPQGGEAQQWFHGTHENVQEFVPRKVGGIDSIGTWFTGDKAKAEFYGPQTFRGEVTPKNLLEAHTDKFGDFFYSNEALFKELFPDKPLLTLERWKAERGPKQDPDKIKYLAAFRKMVTDAGYDGVIWKDSRIDLQKSDTPHDVTVIFHEKPIKAIATGETLPKGWRVTTNAAGNGRYDVRISKNGEPQGFWTIQADNAAAARREGIKSARKIEYTGKAQPDVVPTAPARETVTPPRVAEPPQGGETKYMHPSERPEVPKITEVPPERVPPEPESNDWTTATEPIEKQAGKLRLKGNTDRGYSPLINDVAEFGYRIYQRGVDFARWSAEMVRHLGEKIKPHLQKVWDFVSGKHFLSGTAEAGGIGKTGRRKAAFGAKLLPGYSELDALTGKRSAKLQQSTADVERITKEFKKVAKTPRVENAMSAWAEAQGDLGVLKQQEGLAKGRMFRQAAKDAQRLTPAQQALALKGRQTFDIMGKRVQHYGMLNNFRQNYVPHLFDVGMRLTGFGSAKLQSKFKFAKAAKYQSFFEADQAGLKPKTMEMGKLLGLYTEHANQLIADRQFVQGAQTARSEAGEPLAIPRGRAGPVQSDSGGQAVLVNPHSFKSATDRAGNPVDQLKYRVDPDQPALRKWLFAGKDTQGKPIFMEDDLAIHPELAKRLKAMSGRSRIRQWYDEPTSGGFGAIPKAIVKNLDTAQAVMKREMFGLLAPFHQVQEGTHAIGHTVNPLFNIPKMNKLTPAMIDAAEHGLILKSERGSQAAAMEGVGGKGQFASQIARKFGGPAGRKVADVMDGYQDFLFEHYIPGLKFKTYEHMLPRNMKLYSKELARGEVTAGDIKMLTAQQANAAYGKLNLALLDRSPTLQHILQGLLIAPDFLEARGKFVGQAAKTFMGSKAGQEQLRAIAVLSMANAGMAYVITKSIGGEWDPKRPFEVQNADGTRSYFMRSVPEDFARLVLQGTDKRREFVSARINPLVNTAYQVGVSGRNYRGEKISTMDSLWELVNNYVPIIARSLPVLRNLTQTSRDSPISPLERLAGSLGVKVNRTSPITKTYTMAHDWKIAQGIPPDTGTYPVSKYQQMRYALEDNNQEKAADEFQKLLNAAGGDRKKVLAGFHESLNHPFTESAAMDIKFRNSLDGPSRAIYDAAKDRRHEIMRRFNEMKALEVRAATERFPTSRPASGG